MHIYVSTIFKTIMIVPFLCKKQFLLVRKFFKSHKFHISVLKSNLYVKK